MEVSVVLTTFNGERWIEEQVATILDQTRPPNQLIVCDDGSNDGTLDIVGRVTRGAATEVVVLSGTGRTLGTVANLERGLKVAAGRFIALADQDDVWERERLEAALDQLRDGADAVFSDAHLVDDNGATLPSALWDRAGFTTQLQRMWRTEPLHALARRNVVTGATLAFRSDWLRAVLPIDTPMLHDAWIALILVGMGGRVVADPRRLIRYRLHGANAVGVPSAHVVQRLRQIRREGLRYQEIAAHFAQAAERIRAQGDPAGTADWLSEAAAFWASRELAGPLPLRVVAAGRIYRRGRYGQFASGWRAMALDIMANHAPRTHNE